MVTAGKTNSHKQSGMASIQHFNCAWQAEFTARPAQTQAALAEAYAVILAALRRRDGRSAAPSLEACATAPVRPEGVRSAEAATLSV
jgi:hypothetical protein